MKKYRSFCWSDYITQKNSKFGYFLLIYIWINYIFLYYYYDFLETNYISDIFSYFGNFLLIFSLISFLLAYLQDPGYIDDIKETSKLPSYYNKFCEKCNNWKPPRAYHCKRCNKCIFKMDHHCFFINNCVGIKNYKSFTLFLFYSYVSWFIFCLKNYLALYEYGNAIIMKNEKNISIFSFIFWSLYNLKMSFFCEMIFDYLKEIIISILFNFTTIEYLKKLRGRPMSNKEAYYKIFGVFPFCFIPINFGYVGNYLEMSYEEDWDSNKIIFEKEYENNIISQDFYKYFFL